MGQLRTLAVLGALILLSGCRGIYDPLTESAYRLDLVRGASELQVAPMAFPEEPNPAWDDVPKADWQAYCGDWQKTFADELASQLQTPTRPPSGKPGVLLRVTVTSIERRFNAWDGTPDMVAMRITFEDAETGQLHYEATLNGRAAAAAFSAGISSFRSRVRRTVMGAVEAVCRIVKEGSIWPGRGPARQLPAPPPPNREPAASEVVAERPSPSPPPFERRRAPAEDRQPAATDPASLDYGNCYALAIGNNDYQHLERLKTAENDAAVVAQVLREDYGYDVTLLQNGTRGQIISALNSYRKRLTPRDNLLVYYAGHGYLDRGAEEGYWLPVDAHDDDDAEWISNATITTKLRAIPAKHVMIVSDSCYSGSLTRGLTIKLRSEKHHATVADKKARVVLTSGGIEPVEDGGGDGHSVFARRFIETLRGNSGVMDGTALAQSVRRMVMTDADQEPEYGDIRKCGHDGGDFLFVRRP
jgi:uncharacterized caspase-like protein